MIGDRKSARASSRGIFRAQYVIDGYPVIVAVDSNGAKVAEVVMRRGMQPSVVRALLTQLLNEADPKLPRLTLVTG